MQLTDERRDKIKMFLLECNHYDKARLIQGAKNRNLYDIHIDNEEIYSALERFAKFHRIELHVDVPKIVAARTNENLFIEETDDEGNTTLKKIGNEEIKNSDEFLKVLEKERDILSKKLLKINNLIQIYTEK